MEDAEAPGREEQIVWFYNRLPNGRVAAETVLLRKENDPQAGKIIHNDTSELVLDDEDELRTPGYEALVEEAENIRTRMQELGRQHQLARLASDYEQTRRIKEQFRALEQEAERMESSAAPQHFLDLPFLGSDVEDIDFVRPYIHLLSSNQPVETKSIPERDKKAIERFNV